MAAICMPIAMGTLSCTWTHREGRLILNLSLICSGFCGRGSWCLGEIKPSLLSANYYYVEMGNGNKRFVKKNDVMLVTHGYGGGYRNVTGWPPNCMGYVLNIKANLGPVPINGVNTSVGYKQNVKECIENQGFDCRPIDAYNSPINANEFRVAFKAEYENVVNGISKFHIIMQLSDGTWAGKNHDDPSVHYTAKNLNPDGNSSREKAIWYNVPNLYGVYFRSFLASDTLFFAVQKKT